MTVGEVGEGTWECGGEVGEGVREPAGRWERDDDVGLTGTLPPVHRSFGGGLRVRFFVYLGPEDCRVEVPSQPAPLVESLRLAHAGTG